MTLIWYTYHLGSLERVILQRDIYISVYIIYTYTLRYDIKFAWTCGPVCMSPCVYESICMSDTWHIFDIHIKWVYQIYDIYIWYTYQLSISNILTYIWYTYQLSISNIWHIYLIYISPEISWTCGPIRVSPRYLHTCVNESWQIYEGVESFQLEPIRLYSTGLTNNSN